MEAHTDDDVVPTARDALNRVRDGSLARFDTITTLLRACSSGDSASIREGRARKLFNDLLCEELTALLTPESLTSIWLEVLVMYDTMPAQAEYLAQQLLSGYRLWSHLLAPSVHKEVLFRDQYLTLVTGQFCGLISGGSGGGSSGGLSHAQRDTWAGLCSVAPKECRKYLYRQLCKQDNPMTLLAIQSLSGHIVLEFLAVFLNDLSRNDEAAGHSLDTMLPVLVRCALKNSTLDNVLSIALRTPLSPQCVRYLMGIWSKRDLMYVLWRAGRAWGDPLNVNAGNTEMHTFFTSIIIEGLNRISKEDMTAPCSDTTSDSLLSVLSSGVTACLDVTDSAVRERAMAVANAFSKAMGTKAVFDDPKDAPKPTKKPVPGPNKQSTQRSGPADAAEKVFGTGSSPQKGTDIEIDDVIFEEWSADNAWDKLNAMLTLGGKARELKARRSAEVTEDDLECYLSEADLEAEEANAESVAAGLGPIEDPNKYRLTTLRECLDVFRLPESEMELRQKQYGALMSIPDIVSEDPIDASQMCPPLLRELLRLSNSFSMEDFDVIRMDAVLSLFVAYPKFCQSTIIWAVCSDDLSVGTRLEAMASLAKGAYIMAGLPAPEEELEQFETFKNNPSLAKRRFEEGVAEAEVKSDAKVRVIRPNRLRLMKKKEVVFRNRFGDIAEALFKPIVAMVFDKLMPKPKINPLGISSLTSKVEMITIAGTPVKSPSLISEELIISPRLSPSNKTISSSAAAVALSLPPSKVDSTEGIDLLLPSQAILVLATFLRCSINTFAQRPLTIALQHVGYTFRAATSLQLRRAAAIALHAVAASWAHLQSSASVSEGDRRLRMLSLEQNVRTPIAHLTNIGRVMQELEDPGGDIEGNQQFVEVLSWISETVHEEPDLSLRKIYLSTMKISLDAMKESTGK